MSETVKASSFWKDVQRHLLSGVSFMIPLVVAGGILYAISLLGATSTDSGMVPNGQIMTYLSVVGKAGLSMMIPVFSAYIAYSVAAKPGLAPGFILGFVANSSVATVFGTEVKSGFLGALVLGLCAGYFAKWMKGWKVGKTLRTIMPILVIPTLTTLVVGFAYYFVFATPCAWIMNSLVALMDNLQGAGKYALAVAIGIFGELDYGGPVTKSVSMFTLALINEGNYFPNGLFRIICAVPPIAIFVSTLIAKNKWSESDRDLAKSIAIIGCLGITEGAIPFAAKDLKHVVPSMIVGCVAACLFGAIGDVGCPVPHGGFIVLPVVINPVWYALSIVVGAVVGGVMLALIKKPLDAEEQKQLGEEYNVLA